MAEDHQRNILYQYPGTHKYKGKVYSGYFPESTLKRIEDEAVWSKDTVIVATYPKSGLFELYRAYILLGESS